MNSTVPTVEIYSRKFCAFCSMAKSLLDQYKIPYVEHDATGNTALRTEMIQRAHGAYTFPQIFVGDRHIGGCNELYAWEREGGLKRLVSGIAETEDEGMK